MDMIQDKQAETKIKKQIDRIYTINKIKTDTRFENTVLFLV